MTGVTIILIIIALLQTRFLLINRAHTLACSWLAAPYVTNGAEAPPPIIENEPSASNVAAAVVVAAAVNSLMTVCCAGPDVCLPSASTMRCVPSVVPAVLGGGVAWGQLRQEKGGTMICIL